MEISLEWEGDVAVATWNDGDNRLNPDSVGRLHEIVEEVEQKDGPAALVVTGTGKFFSNGLDLDRFEDHPEELGVTFRSLVELLGRVLVLPAYSVCAINGHAFAGGAMLSSVFDRRIMREDRGFWCLNEVDIGIPITAEMHAAMAAHIPGPAVADAMVTARRFSGPEALDAGIVDAIAPETEVLSQAIDAAQLMAQKDRTMVATHKRLLFGDAAARAGWHG